MNNYETAISNVKKAVALGIINPRDAAWYYANIEMTKNAPLQVIYEFTK